MRESIHIVGAGIAGLSAGCYAQMNGYRSRIFEMHSLPGGLCTAWQRKGYTIDGCIHWLVGSSPKNPFYRLWEEVGAVPNQPIHDHDVFARIEGTSGQAFTLYTDIDRLAAHLIELAPEDRDALREWIRGLRQFARMNLPVERPSELIGPIGRLGAALKSLPHLGVLRRWAGTTVRQFAADLDNPFLREAFPLAFDLPEFPMIAMMMTLAWMHNRASGYPIGGSLPFARSIERRYLDLGGQIEYGARVEEILVEENRAVGVRLADGSEHRSDLVISAADGHATIFDLLGGHHCDETIRGYYDRLPIFPPLLFVGIGVGRTLDGFPNAVSGISFPLREPITVDGRRLSRLSVQASTFDPSLAPPGKTVLKVMIPSSFERWRKLRERSDEYRAEQDTVATEVIRGLDQRFPGLSDHVEMVDVATPTTWNRYTGNWQGSFEGWLPSPKTLTMRMSKTLPGLYDFYMIGQWVQPGGGLPSAVASARHALQMICKADNRRFRTSVPRTTTVRSELNGGTLRTTAGRREDA
jgi:phytoene dehydrogenase-like protein